MAERRRYTRSEKARLVGNAEVDGVRPTARRAHVPVSTLESWRKRGEFAQLRTEKREEVAADMWATVQVGLHRVAELLPLTDDVQKAATATAIVFDKLALMRGEATGRVETRDLTATLDDHEKTQLRDILTAALAEVPDAVGD